MAVIATLCGAIYLFSRRLERIECPPAQRLSRHAPADHYVGGDAHRRAPEGRGRVRPGGWQWGSKGPRYQIMTEQYQEEIGENKKLHCKCQKWLCNAVCMTVTK